MTEVKETGWEGGGHHPAKLTRAEVKVPPMYFTSDIQLFWILERYNFFSKVTVCFRLFLMQRMQKRLRLMVTTVGVVLLIVSTTLRQG